MLILIFAATRQEPPLLGRLEHLDNVARHHPHQHREAAEGLPPPHHLPHHQHHARPQRGARPRAGHVARLPPSGRAHDRRGPTRLLRRHGRQSNRADSEEVEPAAPARHPRLQGHLRLDAGAAALLGPGVPVRGGLQRVQQQPGRAGAAGEEVELHADRAGHWAHA